MVEAAVTHCGFVALVGRPNTGKSTLFNALVGEKISITSNKPQTTRHQILGIFSSLNSQAVFVDTPGLHTHAGKAINRYMNKTASSVIRDVDLVLFLLEAGKWTAEDALVHALLQGNERVVVVVNKIDKVAKQSLLPYLAQLQRQTGFDRLVPVSAKTGDNLDQLRKLILQALPESPFMFPPDQLTDKSLRFIATELVREKLITLLQKELPYALALEIEQFEESEKLVRIHMVVWVERESQKNIVIGSKGMTLKKAGKRARPELEKLFGKKVFLGLWVKTKPGWANNEQLLHLLGYKET